MDDRRYTSKSPKNSTAKTVAVEIDALGKVLAALADLDADGQQFVLRSAIDRLGHNSMLAGSQPTGGGSGNGHAPHSHVSSHVSSTHVVDPNATPQHFLDEKRPDTDVERVACLAFYLKHNRNTRQVKTSDITTLNTEAAYRELSNASYAVGNAEKAGLLTKAGKRGEKQITSFGERIVDALPDRKAVKEVMASHKKRSVRRRKPRKKKAAAK
jgi:hypothetical protein